MSASKMKIKKMIASKGLTKPVGKIVADCKVHEFVAGNSQSARHEMGYYICKEGDPTVGLFGCVSRGISEICSSKNKEDMSTRERINYDATLNELMAELKRPKDTTAKSNRKFVQAGTDKAPSKKKMEQLKNTKQSESVTRVKISSKSHSKWDDAAILKDPVARRFLKDCVDVSESRTKIKTTRLIAALNADETMPWYVFRSGKPIGTYHFSQILKKFGIHSEDINFKVKKAKGFRTVWFHKALRRVQKLQTSKSVKG